MRAPSVNELIKKFKKIRIQETAILEQIETTVEAERHQRSDTQEAYVAINNRVIITNRVRALKGRSVTPSNRHRTFTRVVCEMNQVYFTTDNGTTKNINKQEE